MTSQRIHRSPAHTTRLPRQPPFGCPFLTTMNIPQITPSHIDHSGLAFMMEKALDFVFAGQTQVGEALLEACLFLGLQSLSTNVTNDPEPRKDYPLIELPISEVLAEVAPVDDPAWFQFYRCAFGFDPECNDMRRNVALCAYNLGVFKHEMGALEGDLASMAQARAYYNIALAHVTKGTHNAGSTFTIWLGLAAQNNLGHISSFLGDSVGVQDCREALQDRLALQNPTMWTWFRASLARVDAYSAHQAAAA